MEHFSQKWCIVSLLQPMEAGAEFFWKDWPPHVTLAGVFAVDLTGEEIFRKLAGLLAGEKPFKLTAVGEVHWAADVMCLEKTPGILTLHHKIISSLKESGAVFKSPEYIEDNYTPHSTVQKTGRLQVGDIIQIDNIALIDMFPDGDGYQRKIVNMLGIF